MATFHSGSEGQTQKLQALRRRQKYLAFRAVIVPPVCWGICAASAPWWFPPLKETLGVRFDAQTQGWILLALMLLMISLPVLISLHLKRRARGAKYAATLVSSGIRGEEDARALLSRLPGRVHLFPNRIVHAGNRSLPALWRRRVSLARSRGACCSSARAQLSACPTVSTVAASPPCSPGETASVCAGTSCTAENACAAGKSARSAAFWRI